MERNLTSNFDDLKKDFKRAEQTISLDVDSRWKTMLKTNKAQAAELEAKLLFGSLASRSDKIENDFGDAAFDALSPAMTRYLKKERESAKELREALNQISERVNQMPAITRQARAQELLDEQARRQTLDLELLHRLSGLEECVKKLATSCQVNMPSFFQLFHHTLQYFKQRSLLAGGNWRTDEALLNWHISVRNRHSDFHPGPRAFSEVPREKSFKLYLFCDCGFLSCDDLTY